MRTVLALLLITVSLIFAPAARAFDRCNKLFATPDDDLKTFLVEEGVQSAPVKYFAKAKSIRIETEGAGRLLPFATIDSQGSPIIVYPAIFPPVLCRLALATYLDIETDSHLLTEPAREAGRCVAANRPRETCITDYANDLERRFRATFAKEEEDKKDVAYSIVRSAIGQIAKHEFAHHLLNHMARVGSGEGKIARIDAEFEADYYAILNGIETGETPAAMYYFFLPLKVMEDNAGEMTSPDYESASCRATNVGDFTGTFSLHAAVLLDAVEGGGNFKHVTPDYIRTIAQQLAKKDAPNPKADSCGRLAPVVLRESHEELKRLTAMVAEYADLLPVTPENRDDQLGLNNPEIFKLVARLQRTSQELTYLKGLTARALSLLIRRVSLAGPLSNISHELDDILQSSEDENEYLSGDYGRIMYVKALSILYEHASEPIATRMNEAEPLFRRSVDFRPNAHEAWMNLALIAFARGDCNKAAEMADRSARTAGGQRELSSAEYLRDAMRELSTHGHCAELAQGAAEKLFATSRP